MSDFVDIWDPADAAEEVDERAQRRRAWQADRTARQQASRATWAQARAAAEGSLPPMPVSLVHEQTHSFAKKPDGKRGCAVCGLAMKDMSHHGYPASFNAGGSSKNPHTWQNEKKLWTAFFIAALEEAGLPKGLGRVIVKGRLTFPTKRMSRGPDQGNYRHPLEKHLGDALVEGGWLEDDNWLSYSFGDLGWAYEKDVRRLELTLTGFWDAQDPAETVAPALF
jgi:hypothetical protein